MQKGSALSVTIKLELSTISLCAHYYLLDGKVNIVNIFGTSLIQANKLFGCMCVNDLTFLNITEKQIKLLDEVAIAFNVSDLHHVLRVLYHR